VFWTYSATYTQWRIYTAGGWSDIQTGSLNVEAGGIGMAFNSFGNYAIQAFNGSSWSRHLDGRALAVDAGRVFTLQAGQVHKVEVTYMHCMSHDYGNGRPNETAITIELQQYGEPTKFCALSLPKIEEIETAATARRRSTWP
jgi:hypothetical protein